MPVPETDVVAGNSFVWKVNYLHPVWERFAHASDVPADIQQAYESAVKKMKERLLALCASDDREDRYQAGRLAEYGLSYSTPLSTFVLINAAFVRKPELLLSCINALPARYKDAFALAEKL
jgi:hypothetical protein